MQGKINKDTKIFCLGHHKGHIDLKVQLLKEQGFTNPISVIYDEWTLDDLKQQLLDSPYSLLLVGGAMPTAHPEFTNELKSFVAAQCPTVLVHQVGFADFPEGTTLQMVTAEIVAQAGVKTCLSMLG